MDYEVLWAIVRLDLFQQERLMENPNAFITIKAVVPSQQEAQSEVDRLMALKPAERGAALYFAAPARYFAEGRNVKVDY